MQTTGHARRNGIGELRRSARGAEDIGRGGSEKAVVGRGGGDPPPTSRAGGGCAAPRARVAARTESLPSSAELVAQAELQRELVGHVVALDDPYRSVVVLRYFHGASAAEIAKERGVPAATVRSQLARGLAELRTRLDR